MGKQYYVDADGTWEVDGLASYLIEPSPSYYERVAAMDAELLEKEMLESLAPSEKDVLMAEIEINTLNLLIELEVI